MLSRESREKALWELGYGVPFIGAFSRSVCCARATAACPVNEQVVATKEASRHVNSNGLSVMPVVHGGKS
jgi:hypothetical protein